jgi:hypothetical protein
MVTAGGARNPLLAARNLRSFSEATVTLLNRIQDLLRFRRKPERTPVDLPPIDGICENDCVSAFMQPGVDETTRRLALRKLFHQPKFNLRDGLDDYDGDFRLAAGDGPEEEEPTT